MTDETSVRFQPSERAVSAAPGTTLLEAARDAGLRIESLCGGEGLCGTCKVVVEAGADYLTPPSPADEELFAEDQLAEGYRLSCRAAVDRPDGEIAITIPSSSMETGGVVLTEGVERDVELDPAIRHYRLELPPPSLDDHLADRERLLAGLTDAYGLDVTRVDRLVQQELPNRLREHASPDGLAVTATVYDGEEVIDVSPGLDEAVYGLAIDVGTTTVAVYLLDLRSGERLAVSSRLNPQHRFGGDIMTRMRYTRRNAGGREELQAAILDGVNGAIEEVTREAGVDPDDVYEAVCVGNTAMHHLFLGIEPSSVAGSPYVPANHAALQVKARELGLEVNPAGYVSWLPVSGGWVGPDHVAVLLASGHYRRDELTVCIDIGTNGEISVGNRDGVWVTSAPAGPALEGAEITHGMRAQDGAIDAVDIDPQTFQPTVETIGGGPPKGLCGSGVIDALAELFEVGLVDRRGLFREAVRPHERLRRGEDDVWEYVLVTADAAEDDQDIVLTQHDLREIQMAKAAIQAGTLVLLDELGVDEVDRVVLAGAFGNYIDLESALTIGLYPDVDPTSVEFLGNAAGSGAQLALLDRAKRAEADAIVDQVDYYEIAGTDVFRDHFMDAMYLPHRNFERYPRVKARLEALRRFDDVPT
ncbi:MAG: ASKHA domain-containing protein [Halobacteriales archaeon]